MGEANGHPPTDNVPQRREILCGAAGLLAGEMVLSSTGSVNAQTEQEARSVDARSILNSLELFVDREHPTLGEEYRRVFRIPGTLHAMCEDYRAAASIDLMHDEAYLDTKIQCPLLVLWGERGSVARRYDALAIWGERAARVSDKQMPGGHSFQESHPNETAAEPRAFLSA